MVTITVDFLALFIGTVIGLFLGIMIFSFVEMHEGGPWSSGWSAGYKSGCELRKYIEKSVRNEKDGKDEQTNA